MSHRRKDTRRWFGYTDAQRDEARALRFQGDSVRVIAETLRVPRSTVGDWVHGMLDEPAMIRYCEWCGDAFLANRRDKRYCSSNHARNSRRAHNRFVVA